MDDNQGFHKTGVWIVYDGDCPLCRHSAQAVSLQENCGTLYLLDARKNHDHDLMRDIRAHAFDLNEGIVIFHQEQFYHGSDALRFIALNTTPHGIGNHIVRVLFRYEWSARFAYPIMRFFRNALLKIIGVGKIGETS